MGTKRYLIEEVKCGVTEGGYACGPVPGSVITAVRYRKGDEERWLTVSETMGIPQFFLSEDDIFDLLMKDDFDENEEERLHGLYLDSFEGFDLCCDDIEDSLEGKEDDPAARLIIYALAVTRCPMDDLDDVIAAGKGKYSDEVEIDQTDW